MRIDILTIFPAMFAGPFSESIVERDIKEKLVMINVHDIRQFTSDKHHVVDDYPYGGGAGMVMKPEPLFAAIEAVRKEGSRVILLSPQGARYDQAKAWELSQLSSLVLVCGHYEGVDERVRAHAVDEEISIGDYVLTGGEIPAMVIVDSVVRLIPGVLEVEATSADSFSENLLEYPHYTRPPEFRGWAVPEVLLSGNHQAVAQWRRHESIRRTALRRPDLLAGASLTPQEQEFVK